MSVLPQQRFTRARPCPVCGGYDACPRGAGMRCYGFLSEDGLWCHCTREEHAGTLSLHPSSDTYAHRLSGPCPCGLEHAPSREPVDIRGLPGRWRRRERAPEPLGTIAAFYVYYGPDGKPLHRTVRYRDPKSFRQERYDAGVWRSGLAELQTVLYRLPELLAADREAPVFLTEGEADADRLAGLGLVATAHPNGARGWREHFAPFLADRHVVIVEDNDADGQQHTEDVSRSLSGQVRSLRALSFPGMPEHGDVSDWLAAGGAVDDLVAATTSTARESMEVGA